MIANKDSLGNILTKEQIEYFKNTKVTNDNNELIVCYHGSPNAGFRVFNPQNSKSQFGNYKFGNANVNYFTTDKDSASSYTEFKYDDGTVYEVYLDIKNPYIVDNKSEAQLKSFLNIKDDRVREKELRLFDTIFNKWKGKILDYSDFRFVELNRDLRKLNLVLRPSGQYDSDTDPSDIDLFDLWDLGKNSSYGSSYIMKYQYYTDELFSDDMYEELRNDIVGEDPTDYLFTTDDIVRYVLLMNEEDGTNYDGVIVKDIMDSTSIFSNITTDYITLKSSNQIKAITNKAPTYSDNIDETLTENVGSTQEPIKQGLLPEHLFIDYKSMFQSPTEKKLNESEILNDVEYDLELDGDIEDNYYLDNTDEFDLEKEQRNQIDRVRARNKGKTYHIPTDIKELLTKENYRYGWLDTFEFRVVDLEKIIKENGLDNTDHGMFSRRISVWGDDPDLYYYDMNKEDWLYSPIRLNASGRIIDGNHRLYALYNNGYKYAEVLVPKGALTEAYLTEASRNDLINKSKKGKAYKDQSKGKNRWERKKWSSVASTTREYNSIDMNAFFKKDILTINIPVQGETNKYSVRIRFSGALREIQNAVKRNNNKLDYKSISQALIRTFNGENVYVYCNCLHPTTVIKLLDGTTATVEEMKERIDKGETLYIYSVNEKGDFTPGKVRDVWVTGEATEFVKITLDNGEEIITTPDHPYLRRNGVYDEAKNLKVGDSLMPLYFQDTNGYEMVKNNSSQGWSSVYKQVANTYKSNEIEEAKIRAKSQETKLNYDVAIHHKDFNKKNNTPDNLQVMTSMEHWDYHANLTFDKKPKEVQDRIRDTARENSKKLNANPTPRLIEARKKFVEKGMLRNYDEDRKIQQAEIMRKTMREYYSKLSKEEIAELRKIENKEEWRTSISNSHKKLWENMSLEEYSYRCQLNKDSNAKSKELRSQRCKEVRRQKTQEELNEWATKCGKGISEAWKEHPERFMTEKRKLADKNRNYERTEEIIRKINLSKMSKIIDIMLRDNMPINEESYETVRLSLAPGYPRYTKVFNTWEDVVKYFNLNHKVTKVEFITLESTPVYDISIEGYPNFLVNAGVILHNCPDFVYRMNWYSKQNGFDAAKPREQAPYQNRFAWTNRYDDMGGICKHIALVISNTFWLMKVASVINNYIHYAEQFMQRQFAELIFPKIYGVKYPQAVQLGLFDRKYLKHSKGVIDEINNYGKNRTKFKKEPKPQQTEPEFAVHPKQLSIFDDEIKQNSTPYKKQTIFDMGVEDVEDEVSTKPTFKKAKSSQPVMNKGFKQLSIFDEEEEN